MDESRGENLVPACGGRLQRFLDLLGSGRPLTISAEGKRYTLPVVDAPDWKKQFTDRC